MLMKKWVPWECENQWIARRRLASFMQVYAILEREGGVTSPRERPRVSIKGHQCPSQRGANKGRWKTNFYAREVRGAVCGPSSSTNQLCGLGCHLCLRLSILICKVRIIMASSQICWESEITEYVQKLLETKGVPYKWQFYNKQKFGEASFLVVSGAKVSQKWRFSVRWHLGGFCDLFFYWEGSFRNLFHASAFLDTAYCLLLFVCLLLFIMRLSAVFFFLFFFIMENFKHISSRKHSIMNSHLSLIQLQ